MSASVEDDLVTNLRAIIISSKGGLPLNHVKGDYRDAFGTEIPLRKLGYSNLEEFFKKKPDEFKLRGDRVEAVPKSTSLHIVSLVSKQNDPKRKVRPKAGSKRQRRPVHSGTHSIYKQVVGHRPVSRRPAYDIAPRFHKHINEKQILSIGKAKDADESSVKSEKSDKEEPKKKSWKRDESEEKDLHPERKEPVRSRIERNQFLAKTLEKHGMIPRQMNVTGSTRRSNEPENVFSTFPSEDLIPFDSFEETEPAQSELIKEKSKHLAGLKSLDEDAKSGASGDSTLGSSPTSVTPFLSPVIPFADFEDKPPMPPMPPSQLKSKAQLRLEMIKSTMRTAEENEKKEFKNGDVFHDVEPITYIPNGWTTKLKDLCRINGYPEPTYEDTKTEPDRFFSKVVVGDKLKLSSYPVEQTNKIRARESAAKKAYRHISEELNSLKQIRPGMEATVVSQILKLVGESYGIWSDKLPVLYLEKYGETLDQNWLDIVIKSREFEINPVDDRKFIISKRKSSEEPLLFDDDLEELPSLSLPDSDYWEIYIVNVKNSSKIWCRLIGEEYSDKYDTLMTSVELDPPKNKVITPFAEEIYAVNLEDTWHRVKFIKTKENKKGLVFFIDSGEEEEVELSELYYLDSVYMRLPPQAIPLSLHELDCFADDPSVTQLLLTRLLAQIFIAEIVLLFDVGSSVASVVLWDTSTEEDVNFNEVLLNAVVAEIRAPYLEKDNNLTQVYVSEITDDGDVFLIINKEAIQRIECMILKLTATECDKEAVCTPETVNLEELYLTRCEKTGKYGRAKVTEKKDSGHVVVLFVDDGMTQKTKIKDMYHLSRLSSYLASIPAQALKVRLGNSRAWDCKFASKLRELMPRDESLLLKRTEANGTVPLVEIFRRKSTEDNSLSSIGSELAKFATLQLSESRTRKKSEAMGLDSLMYSNLRPPPVPGVGKFYDVFVTLAASPDLITVQPLRSYNELQSMMRSLQDFCENSVGPPLRETDCVVGSLYAVRHTDGDWYRGVLQVALGSSLFSVYLCDFGDFVIAPLDSLKALPDEPEVFKSLPYQAIRAKLHGVAPANLDWSALDCVDFQNLVVEKEFVATVEEINIDPKNPNNITLELTLTDTSGDNDIYIHKLLIEKEIAVPMSKRS